MKKIKKIIKKKETNSIKSTFILVFVGAFILRIILAFRGTLTLDQNTFIAWGAQIANDGFKGFYLGWSDYLPGYLYVLALLSKLSVILPISAVLLFKLPAIIFDLATAYLLYVIAKQKTENKWYPILGASAILFNPAVLSNSTLWGQVDIIPVFFAILSLYLFKKQWAYSAIALAIGAIVKPQAALAALPILYLIVKNKTPLYRVVLYGLVGLVVFMLGFVPFYQSGNFVLFVIDRINATVSQYPYGSVNAFNFWGLWGFWQAESEGILSEKNVGLVLFAVSSLVAFYKLPAKNKEYWLLSVLFFANFLFFTRMHERHLLPAIVSATVLLPLNWFVFLPLVLVSFTYSANMYYAFVWITQNFKEVFNAPQIVMMIIVNMVSFALISLYETSDRVFGAVVAFTKKKKKVQELLLYGTSFIQSQTMPLSQKISHSREKLLISGILIFSIATRLFGLQSPPQEYFDEVYHAFTAKVVLHNDPKAWEWWNENPQGYAYEWTHPPFAKLAMATSMYVLGENAFAWRFPQALFGTIAIFLLYRIGKKLFNAEVGLLAAALFSLDGLALVMSRIGMNDIYVVCFLLLTLYLFLQNKHFLGGLSLGLALSSKWTTFWFIPVLVLSMILLKKKLTLRFVWYAVLPPLVYLLAYLPQFLSGHDFSVFWGMQQQMWWYHTGLVATHPYTSQWWTWPLLLRPIWLYTSGEVNGMISNIYGMGNPLVFWAGLVGAIASLKYIIEGKQKRLLLVLGAYLGLFMPWAFSPRIMFFYHYFPAVPFLCLITAFVLAHNKKLIIPVLGACLILFIYFYPHWAGIPVPLWLDTSYYWLPGWR